MKTRIKIALAGNPNSGKTTIFNNITGSRQRVGNYPGVTVEKKEGTRVFDGVRMDVVDLPGTYSLTAYSAEELVARNFVIEESPDVVIDVLDASNLERNLYLTTQFIELGAPLVLALNMSDVALRRGHEIDIAKLSALLGAPIVATVGHRNAGTEELLSAALRVARGEEGRPVAVRYCREVDEAVSRIQAILEERKIPLDHYPPRWAALKLLENDEAVRAKVADSPAGAEALSAVAERAAHIEKILGDSPEIIIADRRYGFISGACQEAMKSTVEFRHTVSDKIDSILTHRTLGLPIFLVLMFLMFHLVFTLGEAPMGWIEALFGWLGGAAGGLWPAGSDSVPRSLVVDGIIGGVGGVLTFLPNIVLLFMAIAVLEDTGYMARAAFVMDRLMHRIGLHGKSFIPLLIGMGCTVPAIMATRILESRRDRLVTMLVLPLISCSARQTIYLLIIPAFFAHRWQGPMLWIMYLIGVVIAVIAARLLRGTLFRGESEPFVMELPPYRMPTLRGALIHMWERAWLYVKKAGTVILAISVILWALNSFPRKEVFDRDYGDMKEQARTEYEKASGAPEARARYERALAQIEAEKRGERLAYSISGRIGRFIEPALALMGFDWRIGTSLIGAFAAKEVFVAQMGIVYSLGDEGAHSLRRTLREHYTPLAGFCIMLFCLVSTPCMATIAATRRESGSWGWALLQLGGLTALAFALTAIVYQAGSLLGIGLAQSPFIA